MKRLPRQAVALAILLSVALCVATVYLSRLDEWVQVWWLEYRVSRLRDDGADPETRQALHVLYYQHAVSVERAVKHLGAPVEAIGFPGLPPAPGARLGGLPASREEVLAYLRARQSQYARIGLVWDLGTAGQLGLEFRQGRTAPGPEHTRPIGPAWLWALVLLTGLLVYWWGRERRLRRLRLQSGLCPACGYDLRQSPGCCPECGTPNTSAVMA